MATRDLRTLRQRYKAHVKRREHTSTLRTGQMGLAQDILSWMYEKDEITNDYNSRGYFVRPTGTGKTVSLIDFIMGINSAEKTGDLRWDKRVLVLTPTNILNQQFAAEMGIEAFRNPDKTYAFNIPEDKIGLYDAQVTDQGRRREMLNKHIVVMTYDSFIRAVEEDRLDVTDFASVLLDEVHTRPRGDRTGDVIRKYIFNATEKKDGSLEYGEPPTLAIGATATHLYKNGKTIGDYLFGGDIPIHNTSINNAVQEGEISGYRNVIVETTYNKDARFKGDEDLSEQERQNVLKQNARDDAAIRILKHGRDPITGKAYKDMKSVFYCKDVAHAHHLQEKIDQALGVDNYAKAVSGQTDRKELHASLTEHKNPKPGSLQALTNAKILIHGFDNERAELCFMTHPSESPIEVLQMGGRVLRTHDTKHHGTIFNFLDDDKPDAPLFGELAGGYFAKKDFEFGPSTGEKGSDNPDKFKWPEEIQDLKAHYLTIDIEKFADKRRKAQSMDEKPSYMLAAEEMGRAIGVAVSIVKKYIYQPLQGLYDQRKARAQEIEITDGFSENVAINGQRFPIGNPIVNPGMGYCRTSGHEMEFCLNKEAIHACKSALFGKLPDRKPYMYSKSDAVRVLGAPEGKVAELALKIEDAYHRRDNYQRILKIDDVKFRLNHDVMFCNERDKPQIFFSANALSKLFQLVFNVPESQAQEWWKNHPERPNAVKTPDWLNKDETMHEMGLRKTSDEYKAFDKAWTKIKKERGETDKHTGATVNLNEKTTIECAHKRSGRMPTDSYEFCITEDSVATLKAYLGLEDLKKPPESPKKGPRR